MRFIEIQKVLARLNVPRATLPYSTRRTINTTVLKKARHVSHSSKNHQTYLYNLVQERIEILANHKYKPDLVLLNQEVRGLQGSQGVSKENNPNYTAADAPPEMLHVEANQQMDHNRVPDLLVSNSNGEMLEGDLGGQ